jgi:hypothetical protein
VCLSTAVVVVCARVAAIVVPTCSSASRVSSVSSTTRAWLLGVARGWLFVRNGGLGGSDGRSGC